MKVQVYTYEGDYVYPAYLDDDPDERGVYRGNLKHGACEDMTAVWNEKTKRFKELWREPFDLARYL